MNRNNLSKILIYFLLLVVIGYSGFIRIRNISTSPGGFRDEGTYLEAGWNLVNGEMRLGAVNCTFASPFMTEPPLHPLLGGIAMKIFKPELRYFRLVSALFAVLATLLIFFVGREIKDEKIGLVSAAIFAFYPFAVIYNRMGFGYNIYMFWALLVFFFSLKYLKTNKITYLILAIIFTALSILTIYYAVVLIIFLMIILISKKKYKLIILPFLSLLPIILFFLYHIIAKTSGFSDDFTKLFFDFSQGSRELNQLSIFTSTMLHFKDYFGLGGFFVVGTIGLFLIKEKYSRNSILLIYLLMLGIYLVRKDTQVATINYPLIPVLPILAVGCGQFFFSIIDVLSKIINQTFSQLNSEKSKKYASAICILLLLSMLYVYRLTTLWGIYGGFETTLDFGCIQDTNLAYEAANFINDNTNENDLVISDYNFWWMIDKAKVSNIPQSLIKQGIFNDFYRYPLSQDRFFYDPSLKKSKFVVIDHFYSHISSIPVGPLHQPIKDTIINVEKNWKNVFDNGEYRVYINPDL